MIDLTPLDVRKKKGDFRRTMRGYDAESVDDFLDQVADRLEEVVRENYGLREKATQLSQAITSYRERERAMNEALISAQQLREETRLQAEREAELTLREARVEAERLLDDARRRLTLVEESLRRVQSQRGQYLRGLRTLLERHLDEVSVEEDRLSESPASEDDSHPRAAVPQQSPEWLALLDRSSPESAS
jgi:DivIVA domain-containing protein